MEDLNAANKNFGPNVNVVNSLWGKKHKIGQKIFKKINLHKKLRISLCVLSKSSSRLVDGI
jgi:hypothetical protein